MHYYKMPADSKRTFEAHRYQLISASPVFWAMFCGEIVETGEIRVSDIEPEPFRFMLRYSEISYVSILVDGIDSIVVL